MPVATLSSFSNAPLPYYFITRSSNNRRIRVRHELGDASGGIMPQLVSDSAATDAIVAASEAPQPPDSIMDDSEINEPMDNSAPVQSTERVRVIWGTNIVISDTIAAFKSFLANFTLAHRFSAGSAEAGDRNLLASDFEPLYPRLLRQLHDTEIRNLNLDVKNLEFYPLTVAVKQQLVQYPQEVIPLMDMVINEAFTEMKELQKLKSKKHGRWLKQSFYLLTKSFLKRSRRRKSKSKLKPKPSATS